MTPQELKNSILQLAIQGKLVEQRPQEGTGEELYGRIQREKQQLTKAGTIKKEKPLPGITEDEKPFDIPDSWKWAYIGDLFQHNTGKALNSSNRDGTLMDYITTSNLYWNRFELDNLSQMLFTKSEVEKCTVVKGDLLVLEGGDIGRAAIWSYDFPMRIQNHIHRLRPYANVCIEYFYHVFFLYKFASLINGKGIGIQGLSSSAIHKLMIPLPPLAEQKRIVAKIEELLPYIDRYEQAWSKLEDFNKRFPTDMQKSILQMAIQGKLVEQLPEEGTGEELYKQIQAEKQRLIKAGTIKKEKPLPEITDDEKPFDIPESWKWVRWGALAESIQYGYNAAAQESGRIKMVRISDIQDGNVLWATVPFCEIKEDDVETYILKKNDILFARTGGTVGKSYLVKDVPEEAIYAGYLIRTRYSSLLCPEYMKHFMESQLYWTQLRNGTIATAQPNCNGQTLSKMVIPLPPLSEQKRTVAKLEEILPLCEKLK
ncbi:MAG: restriction endonuclease subunit S [Candidatus Metalachnospira sp.]|nr:restriction endonuclease subunit S [Candidatus Metalachnospira sp.]